MTALAIVSDVAIGQGVTPAGPAAFYPVLAVCPGCSSDPRHPTARACDRIGCPIKHMSSAVHEGCSAA